jgi:hypothetical protein
MSDEKDAFARVLELIEHAGRIRDVAARELAQDLVASVLDVHRVALERAVELQPDAFRALANDPVIANVLLLHGLHPTPLAERVERVLASIGPAQGGTAKLVSIENGVARVAVMPSGGASLDRARAAIEKALVDAAPDLEGWTVEEFERLLPVASLVREGHA